MRFRWPLSGEDTDKEEEEAGQRTHYFSTIFRSTPPLSPGNTGRRPHRKFCSPQPPRLNVSHLNISAPAQRSPTSTRSIIDPASSPSNSARPLSSVPYSDSPISPVTPQAYAAAHHRSHRGSRTSVEQNQSRRQRPGPRWRPRHSRGTVWFPAMKHSAVRNKVFACIISGGILVITLVVYMALMLAKVPDQQFNIVFILAILMFAVLFFHSAIRLGMVIMRVRRQARYPRVPSQVGSNGFALPESPLQVRLGRDEELGILEDDTERPKSLPPPPPAYGLWRGSVRVDPNLLYWQRAEHARDPDPIAESPESEHRPPSYVSERNANHTADGLYGAEGQHVAGSRYSVRYTGGDRSSQAHSIQAFREMGYL